MTKKELFDFLDKALEGMTVDKKQKEIEKIKYRYLGEYKKIITKGMRRCPLCGKYFPEDIDLEFKIILEKEEFTHTDGGYGDDDFTSTFEYLVEYHKCPICKKFFIHHKY